MRVKDMHCTACGDQACSMFDGKPYCNKHWLRLVSHGSVETIKRKSTCEFEIEGDILRIITKKGDVITADASDYEMLSLHSWCISKTGYAVANISGKTTKMHRFIVGLDNCEGMVVDHINRNHLDNRRSNLRICTVKENMRNVSVSKTCISGNLGIRKTPAGKYNVRIVADGIEHHIGNYDTVEEAVSARNKAEEQYHGKYASHLSNCLEERK